MVLTRSIVIAMCGAVIATAACQEPIAFEPWQNPHAKADAFRLYYKERIERVLRAYNRFQLVNDVVPAHTLGATYVDKQGATYDIHLHPVDNNEIGTSAFNTYQAWKVFGTRELELTLIRQFEGLVVAEMVSGIPGLTCREWQPGFVLTIDGFEQRVERRRLGVPVEPAVSYPDELEAELLQTFFNDGIFTYHGDPRETYFTYEPLLNTGDYAMTFVFEEMPRFLRVSDCCSSFMVSQRGPYEGYFWGNHNSRDNFPDFALGYFAACAAKDDPSLSPDVRISAARACESGKRIGDSVLAHGYNLMTVSEFEPYDEDYLIVAGQIRPDGTDEGPEWLGSMNNCQMAYMAKALSRYGLHSPREKVANPGAYEVLIIRALFELLGLPPPEGVKTCRTIDDAYAGLTWEQLLNLKVGRTSFCDIARELMNVAPEPVAALLLDLADLTHQPEKSAFALVYYALMFSNSHLLQEARETLYHIVELQRRCARIVYDWAMTQPEPDPALVSKAVQELQIAATLGHAAGIAGEEYDPFGFSREEMFQQRYEEVLVRPDSQPRPLMSDEEIWEKISWALQDKQDRPLTYQRYLERFPTEADKPLRRCGDHYEAVGLDGLFHEIPNIRHQGFGGVHLWDSLPMCALAPTVLDCSWARLGCARPDLDGNRRVDTVDLTLFYRSWYRYGEGASCDASTQWCGHADLDRNGNLDAEDRLFIESAQGCWY